MFDLSRLTLLAWLCLAGSLSLVGCFGAPGDAQAEATADSTAEGADEADTTPTSSSGSDARSGDDDGRPPVGGVRGGRDAERETLVVLEPLTRGPIRDEIVVSARVETRVSVSVIPQLSGLPITHVLVDEGDRVTAGQELMRLFDEDLQLTTKERKSSHDQALKEIDRAQLQLEEDESRIARAERQAQKAAADHQRLAGLLEEDLVNQQEVDDALLAADTALDDIALARKTRDRSEISLQLARIAADQTDLQYQRAVADLEDTVVRTSIAGVVAMRAVEIGELSGAEQAFRIVDLEQPILNLRVPQDSLARLAEGQRVEAQAVTLESRVFEGVVRKVNPVLDEITGSVRVIVDLTPSPDLNPGLFCQAHVVTSERDDALLVDKRAVLREDELPHVFVIEEDGEHVRKLNFQPGASTALLTEVLGDAEGNPLPEGLRVVVVGQESLKDGGKVRVQETAY